MLTMLAVALLSTPVGVAGPATTATPVRPLPASDATIQLTLNGKEFAPGAPVKVQVEASQDGYMVVFQVDGGGRIRVLFPLDPDLDAFVRGGKRYDLRSQGNKQSFLADDRGGSGVVYAAISRRPLSFGLFAVNAHWDYETIRLRDEDSDVEAELNAIVGRMGDNVRFDYDIVGYRVYDTAIIAGGGAVSGYVDPFYDPYWSCLACGWGYGSGLYVNVGFGGWWGYGYPYYPYYNYPYYGYPYYGYPYYGGGGMYPGQYPPINVVPLPRPPTAAAYGDRARARQPQALPVPLDKAFAPDLTSAMRPGSRSGSGTPAPQGTYTGRARSRGNDVAQGRPTSGGDGREASPPSSSAPASGRSAPSSPPPSTGSTRSSGGSSGSSGSSGGYDDRSRRRPELSNDVTRRTFEATASARAASTQQPIFREPRRESTVDRSRTGSSQRFPVYRDPPRAERSGQASGSAPQPTQRSAPQPSSRSAPQPSSRSAPQSAPQMGRSSPPPQASAPASSPNQGRSRGRPN